MVAGSIFRKLFSEIVSYRVCNKVALCSGYDYAMKSFNGPTILEMIVFSANCTGAIIFGIKCIWYLKRNQFSLFPNYNIYLFEVANTGVHLSAAGGNIDGYYRAAAFSRRAEKTLLKTEPDASSSLPCGMPMFPYPLSVW